MDQGAVGVALSEPDGEIAGHSGMMRRLGTNNNKARVMVVMFFAVVFGAFGDISLRKGMKTIGAMEFRSMYQALVTAASNVYVLGGVVLLIAFLVLYLASLSWEDLSYVLPLTAADYVLVTLFAYFLLSEDVSPLRWAGSVLVASGIALVAKT